MMTSKLPGVGTTIFTVMSSLASEHHAINLGQGFPDYPMEERLVQLVNKAMKDGFNQYTHMNGYPLLREAIAEKVNHLYAAGINADSEITVTPGATYALYTALTTILHPGDEVIIFEPAYDCYIPQVELSGATAITIALEFPGYSINWETVRRKVNARTRAIIINSPHNPTGAVLSMNDIRELEKIVDGTGIFIISDEVYEHLIFDDLQHESVLKSSILRARSFVIFSFGKVYHCTGWKLGYCIAPAALMTEFRKIHQFNAFTCDTPKQVALSEFIQHREAYTNLGKELQKKRDYFEQLMKTTPLIALPSHGSYFQSYSYEGLSELDEMEFAVYLTKKYGVATIPVSAFYKVPVNNKVLRFCFSKKEATLEAAVERLRKL